MAHKRVHAPATVYVKYEVIAGLYVRMFVRAWAARRCVCMCVFVMGIRERERETVEGEREFVTSKISEEQSRPRRPAKRFMNPSIGRVCAQLCAHVHTQRCQ